MSETEVNPYQSPEARIEDPRLHPPARPPLASLGARMAGAGLDGVFGILASVPALIALVKLVISHLGESPPLDAGEVYGALFAEYPGYMAAWLGLMLLLGIVNLVFLIQTSQSIGKRIVGTQIATPDGRPAGTMRIVGLRVIVSQILYNLPFVGVPISLVGILLIFGKERRCLHDYLAGTIVIVRPRPTSAG
jgi:uncharacterized RDD family membrane protein YckC